MTSKPKASSRLEYEISRSRDESNWKKVSDLAEQLNQRSTGFDVLVNFLIGECKLEQFLEENPPIENNIQKAKTGLTEAKRYLQTCISEQGAKLNVMRDAHLLLAKLLYSQGLYDDALSHLNKGGLESLTEKQLSNRIMKVVAESFAIKVQKFLDYQISVTVHKALNSCRGVVSDKELMMASESEIIEGLSKQGVIAACQINIRRGNKIIPTKHVILTFSSSKLPSSITAGYVCSPVKPYTPNPLCCCNCQRFGHSKAACRGKLTCSNYGIAGHSANGCKTDPHGFHCKQDHSSDSKYCPQWKTEKKIQEIKIKHNIAYAEAKKLISQEKNSFILAGS
ncbi:Tetratricopeptide repeat protein 7B [Araneus ventricosus]|uniref:Tetratricopeptide repeat protein 7B n=1 Tax=Araneus ventricosus TaxID=182803 RepID=A0A4Y2GIX2_ARAVE|nr:Tetratricopeptide repeat protein 7B [Araneus ventricosus]